MAIYFYVPADEHGYLSNFSAHGVVLKERYWPTVEHYFQAQKAAGTPDEEKIRNARTPKESKRLGRETTLRADWEEVKDEVMYDAVRAKFFKHSDIAARLLETGDEELVENAPGDFYWGAGSDGTGRNKLGKILMRVRDELRAERASE